MKRETTYESYKQRVTQKGKCWSFTTSVETWWCLLERTAAEMTVLFFTVVRVEEGSTQKIITKAHKTSFLSLCLLMLVISKSRQPARVFNVSHTFPSKHNNRIFAPHSFLGSVHMILLRPEPWNNCQKMQAFFFFCNLVLKIYCAVSFDFSGRNKNHTDNVKASKAHISNMIHLALKGCSRVSRSSHK